MTCARCGSSLCCSRDRPASNLCLAVQRSLGQKPFYSTQRRHCKAWPASTKPEEQNPNKQPDNLLSCQDAFDRLRWVVDVPLAFVALGSRGRRNKEKDVNESWDSVLEIFRKPSNQHRQQSFIKWHYPGLRGGLVVIAVALLAAEACFKGCLQWMLERLPPATKTPWRRRDGAGHPGPPQG